MDKFEGIKRMFQANEFAGFERCVLSFLKENGCRNNVYYITLLNMFSGNAVADILYLMYSKPYFRTTDGLLPDIAANPLLIGLTEKGERRLQELLTQEKDK